MQDIANMFGITYPYDNDKLKTAYKNKLDNIRNNNTLTQNEKYILTKKYYQTYKSGKIVDAKSNNIFRGITYSYIANNNNGNKIIAEKTTHMNNGIINSNSIAYSINKKGEKTKLNYDDVIQNKLNRGLLR